MNEFYFFKNDGQCKWMHNEINNSFPKYLHDPIEHNGKIIKFYLVLNWISGNKRGANPAFLDELGINYVKTVNDLPEGAGIYITGYDADLVELEAVKKKGTPLIEHPCPWIKHIKQQLKEVNSATHQCVFMIDTGHIVYNCYQSIFPDDIIIVTPQNYQNEIETKRNGKPIYLIVYAVFRKKDADRAAEYINNKYFNPDNKLNGYYQTLCRWIKQGLIEEIEESINKNKLDEVWIICNSEVDRSTKSIITEITENGSTSIIIKNETDIPDVQNSNLKIGVVIAPIPLSKNSQKIINIIKQKYNVL